MRHAWEDLVQERLLEAVAHSGEYEMSDYLTSMGEEDSERGVVGFMCKTDWEFEIGQACGGNRIYPSVEDMKECCKCWTGCGIVQVRVVFEAIITQGTDP